MDTKTGTRHHDSFLFRIAASTDIGPVRSENQDAWAAVSRPDNDGCALIACDGMGSMSGSGKAAHAAVAACREALVAESPSQQALYRACRAANDAVRKLRDEGTDGGTTLVAAALSNRIAFLANIGDSRAYLIREGSARQITTDHSWVEEEVRGGRLAAAQAIGHPRRNVITRAIIGDPVEADIFTVSLRVDDVILLCTDGVWGPLGDERIGATFSQQRPLQETMDAMCAAAMSNGGTDNATAVACHIVSRLHESHATLPATVPV